MVPAEGTRNVLLVSAEHWAFIVKTPCPELASLSFLSRSGAPQLSTTDSRTKPALLSRAAENMLQAATFSAISRNKTLYL